MRGDLKGVGHLEMEQKDEFKHTHRMMEREADRAQSGEGREGAQPDSGRSSAEGAGREGVLSPGEAGWQLRCRGHRCNRRVALRED